MNTTDPKSIAREIRNRLRRHERNQHGAVRIPDDAAQLVADALDHYAAACAEVQPHALYERPAVLWMDAARHIARVLTLTERQAVDLTEIAADALAIAPAWRETRNGPRTARYLTFTGRELARLVRYAKKRSEA